MSRASAPEAIAPTPPPVAAESGWTDLSGIFPPGVAEPFVSRDGGDQRLRVALFRRDSDLSVVGRIWFGPGSEGPPGHAHGGAIMTALDEAMGAAVWIAGHMAVAVRLTTSYRKLTPLGTDAHVHAWAEAPTGRKIFGRARLTAPDGTLLSEGEGLFVIPRPERFADAQHLWRPVLDLHEAQRK